VASAPDGVRRLLQRRGRRAARTDRRAARVAGMGLSRNARRLLKSEAVAGADHVAAETLGEATSVQFRAFPACCRASAHGPNDWGLAFELRARSRRIGPGRATPRARSATSARRARSSGSIGARQRVRSAHGQGFGPGRSKRGGVQRFSRRRRAAVETRRSRAVAARDEPPA